MNNSFRLLFIFSLVATMATNTAAQKISQPTDIINYSSPEPGSAEPTAQGSEVTTQNVEPATASPGRKRRTYQDWIDQVRAQRQIRREQYKMSWETHRRWINPHGEFLKDMYETRRQAMRSHVETQRKELDQIIEQQWMFNQAPHDWNNPWYFRGY